MYPRSAIGNHCHTRSPRRPRPDEYRNISPPLLLAPARRPSGFSFVFADATDDRMSFRPYAASRFCNTFRLGFVDPRYRCAVIRIIPSGFRSPRRRRRFTYTKRYRFTTAVDIERDKTRSIFARVTIQIFDLCFTTSSIPRRVISLSIGRFLGRCTNKAVSKI